eukprot:4750465-Ditylum_brightwellii.AAC.1
MQSISLATSLLQKSLNVEELSSYGLPTPEEVALDDLEAEAQEYKAKYQEPLPPSAPTFSPPLPLSCHCSSQPCKLNKKYFNEDNINLVAHQYNSLDNDACLNMIHLPPNPCCYNIHTAEEKLNQRHTGLDEHYDLLQDLDWKSSFSILGQSASSLQMQHFFAVIDHYNNPLVTGCLDSLHPHDLAAQIADSDTPTWGKAT